MQHCSCSCRDALKHCVFLFFLAAIFGTTLNNVESHNWAKPELNTRHLSIKQMRHGNNGLTHFQLYFAAIDFDWYNFRNNGVECTTWSLRFFIFIFRICGVWLQQINNVLFWLLYNKAHLCERGDISNSNKFTVQHITSMLWWMALNTCTHEHAMSLGHCCYGAEPSFRCELKL